MTDQDPQDAPLVRLDPVPLTGAGLAADRAASRGVFTRFRESKAERTRKAYDDDLARWAQYLADVGAPSCEGWTTMPECWRGVSWGLVEGFLRWQLGKGYAVASINRALATVRSYAGLAAKAGALDPQALALIRTVKGYARKEGRRLDQQRERTRVGRKKAEWRELNAEQIAALKAAPDLSTPAGRRDRLMMLLFLDHGLRVGELAGLERQHLDPQAGTLRFYREKTGDEQLHELTGETLRAALAYLPDAPTDGSLWRGSRKGGTLDKPGWGVDSIRDRVRAYGAQIGAPDLSPHDLRHTWTTRAVNGESDLFAVKDAGGWATLAMVDRYRKRSKIANKGIRLADE